FGTAMGGPQCSQSRAGLVTRCHKALRCDASSGSSHARPLVGHPSFSPVPNEGGQPVPGSLQAHDISKSYGAVTVLDRVSLRVAPRDRVGIVGPNGIGKSTLLRVLAGQEEPDAGTV